MTLREYIFQKRIEQKSFAAQLDISPSMLTRIKNGERRANAPLALRIEKLTKGSVRATTLRKAAKP